MKKIIGITLASLCFTVSAFAQSAEYSKHLAKAKEYEQKKQWAFALDSYYDAIGCADEPSQKVDAMNGYQALSSAIKSGNPGLGSYNSFTIHDEWKKLLMDAEKLGSSICKYEVRLGKLERGDLNYDTKTATYKAKVQFNTLSESDRYGRTSESDRYGRTIGVIVAGYKTAYKSDWKDLPEPYFWPLYSVSSAKNSVYDVAGAKIFEVKFHIYNNINNNRPVYFNAFDLPLYDGDVQGNYVCELPYSNNRTLYDYKFNIVDENGKELVKAKRWLLHKSSPYSIDSFESEISFDGITPEIMDLIDNGKAFINPVAVYLNYGKYNPTDDDWTSKFVINGTAIKGEARSFVKNLPEVQLDMSKAVIYCWNKTEDLKASRFADVLEYVVTPFVKSYFEKISENTIALFSDQPDFLRLRLLRDSGYDKKLFIKLDSSYKEIYDYNYFELEDASGKIWKITKTKFLAILKKITNQTCDIGYLRDIGPVLIIDKTEEEITPSKKSKRR